MRRAAKKALVLLAGGYLLMLKFWLGSTSYLLGHFLTKLYYNIGDRSTNVKHN